MDHPQLSFQVRRTSTESLAQVGARVTAALGCALVPSRDPMFDRGEALEGSVLGLKLQLSHDPEVAEGQPRTYVLTGGIRDDIEAEWDLGVPVVSVSGFVLGVLTIVDGEGWYLPGPDELRAEAGLPAG